MTTTSTNTYDPNNWAITVDGNTIDSSTTGTIGFMPTTAEPVLIKERRVRFEIPSAGLDMDDISALLRSFLKAQGHEVEYLSMTETGNGTVEARVEIRESQELTGNVGFTI